VGQLVTEKRSIAIANSNREDAGRLALLNETGERAARQSAHLIARVEEEQVGRSRRVVPRRHSEQREQTSPYHSYGISDGSRVPVSETAAREMQASAGYGDGAPVCDSVGQ
jgi:hypothetical protein